MDEEQLEAAVAAVTAGLDLLLAADPYGLAPSQFAGLLERLEVQRRRFDAVDVQLLAAAGESYVAAHHCRASTADFLVHQLRLSPGEARARVRRARDLGPRHTIHGEPLPPTHAMLAAAQRAGQVSAQQLDVATKVLGTLPPDLPPECHVYAEEYLLTSARHENPCGMSRTAVRMMAKLDPDGTLPDDDRIHDSRYLHLARRRDGSWNLRGSLTDECGLVWQALIDAVSAPAPADDGEPDPRTPEQRAHDGIRDLGVQILRSGELHDKGGAPLTVIVRVDAEDLTDSAGVGVSAHGHALRLRTLAYLAGDAELIPGLFDRAWSDSQLVLGRSVRCATPAQRRALTARDGGCSFPGCDRPASWCEAHHLREWVRDLGPTDLDNLCLVCPFHHRQFQSRGWTVVMLGGRPHWIPPKWLDPDQTPRLNTSHHLPKIVFDPDGRIRAVLDLGRASGPPPERR